MITGERENAPDACETVKPAAPHGEAATPQVSAAAPEPHKKKRRTGRVILKLLPFAAGLASLAVLELAPRYPLLVDEIYSRGIYPVIAQSLSFITSAVPVSVAEIAIWLAAAACVAALIFVCRRLVKARRGHEAKTRRPRLKSAGRAAFITAQALCLVLAAHTLLCAPNYHRPTFAYMSGLEVRDSSVQELAALCRDLAAQANALAPTVPRGENGVSVLSADIWQTMRRGRDTFGKLAEAYDFLPDWHILPKPVLTANVMSALNITGVFIAFSCEANINIQSPPYNIPATICHELAHTRGFMREDEANFIAFLACRESDYSDFRYSGVMLALVHSMNSLYSSDRALHSEVSAMLSGAVQADFAYNNAYWRSFETPVSEAATAVNNVYLQANRQADGVKSYGRMTDLLLADYRERCGVQ